MKQTKEQYYKNALQDNERDPRNTWQIINELTSRKTHSSSVKEIKLDNNSIRDPCKLSSVSRTTFQTLVWRLLTIFTTPLTTLRIAIISWRPNIDLIWKQLNLPKFLLYCESKLCESKATGLDKISAKLLRECADLIASSVCCIFNRSITTGIFPEEWRCSKVIPLFKQGERSDFNHITIVRSL